MKAERVIIVGAGPAGLSAALKLIRSGIRPTLVDEAAESGGPVWFRVVSGRFWASKPTKTHVLAV